MDPSFAIRPVKDVEEACHYFRDWPVKMLGWNHGFDDKEARLVYFEMYRDGMLLGTIKDGHGKEEVVGCVFACKHSDEVGYIGAFIVPPQYRLRGYGRILFKEAIQLLGSCRFLGLDGKFEMFDAYQRSGFQPNTITLTYRGDIQKSVVTPLLQKLSNTQPSILTPLAIEHLDGLVQLEDKYTGMNRNAFWKAWIDLHSNDQAADLGRAGWVVLDDESTVTHFGTVRPSVRGFAVVLYGKEIQVINQLLLHMANWVLAQLLSPSWKLPKDHQLAFNFNACASNPMAVALVESLGFDYVVSHARMWRGPAPILEPSGLFSLSTLTIG
ncbi:hypothetical protein DM01DRAFT_1340043 [Hesseltinella vesiculosa]|uniref:N-acetyltransferase domain-containing protein n=1 Tax=Hesseltinella vesiculosa TaxID=101127 RepID=A0A1X2G5G8_9FUNG|nr:hypothetical protein DM01DRAFT_1340043 [Hesseltinella vesiculosa]